MLLGEYIKEFRSLHGNMSQAEFARLSGISKGYISMLENNQNPKSKRPISPTMDTFQKVADATGITTNELFDIVEQPTISRGESFDLAEAIKRTLIEGERRPSKFDLAKSILGDYSEQLPSMTTKELSEIDSIFSELTPSRQTKLLELARFYLDDQRKSAETE